MHNHFLEAYILNWKVKENVLHMELNGCQTVRPS
jgi:hypothetical protein